MDEGLEHPAFLSATEILLRLRLVPHASLSLVNPLKGAIYSLLSLSMQSEQEFTGAYEIDRRPEIHDEKNQLFNQVVA